MLKHSHKILCNTHPTTTTESLQSCPTWCDPIDSSPPGSSIPGILQARTLEWVVIFFSNAWKWKVKSESEVAQSCPTLRNPMDCSPPGSSVHGSFQARVLEWGAIAFSEYPYTYSQYLNTQVNLKITPLIDQNTYLIKLLLDIITKVNCLC